MKMKPLEREFFFVEPTPVQPLDAAKHKPRVLIAEDDWAFRDMLSFAFEDEGCNVVAVGDGAALLDTLASSFLPKSPTEPFDLLVSDVRMPKWNGLKGLIDLIHSPLAPPVVLITAFGGEELHAEAMREGAAAVLDKPFDLASLTTLGRRVIARNLEKGKPRGDGNGGASASIK